MKAATRGFKQLTTQNAFSELRLHLTRATVSYDYSFVDYTEDEVQEREGEPAFIDQEEPFRALIFEEIEPSQETLDAAETDL